MDGLELLKNECDELGSPDERATYDGTELILLECSNGGTIYGNLEVFN